MTEGIDPVLRVCWDLLSDLWMTCRRVCLSLLNPYLVTVGILGVLGAESTSCTAFLYDLVQWMLVPSSCDKWVLGMGLGVLE